MTPPCKGCTDRQMGCHGRCGKYAAYKAEVEKASNKRQEIASFNSMVIKGKLKAIKSRRRKG